MIAGEGRLLAAKERGFKQVPTVCLAHMSQADQRAYRILDNRIAELADWDPDLLKIELSYVIDFDPSLPDIVGFETGEIDVVLDGPATPTKPDPADAVPEVAPTAVSRLGDLWLMDDHRVLCGDTRSAEDCARLMGGEAAQMVFADPPYNVPNTGFVTGRAGVREFAMAHGEMSQPEFTAFLREVMQRMADVSADGAIHFICMDWRHLRETLEAGYQVYSELKNLCVWAKTNGGMGSLYRSAHELVLVWKKGSASSINNVNLGKHGRYRTNVWQHAGANSFGRSRDGDLAMHPTVKPCALVADAIKDCSKPNGIILDGFGGSGTTLIAAAKTRRRGYLLEYDPRYVDVIVRRWQAWSGREARHAETGLTFAQVAEERAAEAAVSSNTREAGHGA